MSKKIISKQEQLRKRVYEFYVNNKKYGKKFTYDHFTAENVPKTTIYRVIRGAENEYGHKRKHGSGRKPQIMTKRNIKRLKDMFDHKDGVSQRQAARKFNCSQPHICNTLAAKTSIRSRKKIKIPKRTEQQQAVAQTKCSRLMQRLKNRNCVMDDESYFTLAHSSINGNARFSSSDVNKTPATVKYKPTEKFQKKLLVWIAISPNGMSEPFFVPSGLAINQHIYLKDCINARLMPFIKQHHSDGNYLFWPDLASSHYAKSVIEYLDQENVNYVERHENPANLPECRPIENFWGILKGLVYKNNWQAENIEKLRSRIKRCIKNIDPELIQSLARSIPSLVDKVRRNGVIEKN